MSPRMTIIDFLPRCLGPLPDGAADYCSEYMPRGIKQESVWIFSNPKGTTWFNRDLKDESTPLRQLCHVNVMSMTHFYSTQGPPAASKNSTTASTTQRTLHLGERPSPMQGFQSLPSVGKAFTLRWPDLNPGVLEADRVAQRCRRDLCVHWCEGLQLLHACRDPFGQGTRLVCWNGWWEVICWWHHGRVVTQQMGYVAIQRSLYFGFLESGVKHESPWLTCIGARAGNTSYRTWIQ